MPESKKKKIRRSKRRKHSPVAIVIHRLIAVLLLIGCFVGIGCLMVKGWQGVVHFLFGNNEQFTLEKVEVSTDGDLPIDWLRGEVGVSVGDNLFALPPDVIVSEICKIPKVKLSQLNEFCQTELH